MRRRLRLGAALGAAVAFTPKAWAGAWGALVVLGLALSVPILRSLNGLPLALWALVTLVAGLMAQGALYRLGVSRTGKDARALGLGIGGLQLGKPELRLLGAGLLVAGFLAMVAMALGLVLIFVWTGLDRGELADYRLPRAGQPLAAGDWIFPLMLLGAAWVLAQLGVRLSLYKAATVARRRVVSLDAMGLAAGVFWPLLGGLILAAAPALLLVGWKLDPGPAGVLGKGALAAFRAAVLAGVALPFSTGFLSAAYKQLEYHPQDPEGDNRHGQN